MPPLSEVLPAALPPILAALVLVSWRGARFTGLATAIGVFAAWWWIRSELPPWPWDLLAAPVGMQWLVWSIIGAALLATLEHVGVLRGKIALAVAAVFVALATYLVLQKVAANWSAGEILLRVGVGALVAVLVMLATRTSLATSPATPAPAVVFSVLLSLLSVLLGVGGHDKPLGQLCGAVAAAIGAAAGTWLWKKPFALTPAEGTCLGGAWALLVIAGANLVTGLPWTACACAMVSPCALLLLRPSLSQRRLLWPVAALLVTGAPMVGALAIAFASQSSDGY